MRYFTKEWYETMQHTYFPVRVSAKAEVFSEEYFQDLYKRKQRKWLKNMHLYWEEDVAEGREDGPWNEENERVEFERSFKNDISTMQDRLPEEILSMVADIRVLALGLCSRQVKQAIEQFCHENEKRVQKAFEDYNRHLEALQKKHDLSFLRHMEFHDRVIDDIETNNDALKIRLRDPYEEDGINLCFENARILRRDESVSGGDWLYEEIHETQQGFELHVLCFNWDFEEPLGEMIVQFGNMTIEEIQTRNSMISEE